MKMNNEKMAEILGFSFENNLGWYDNEEVMPVQISEPNEGNCYDELKFDSDYNWLMVAIQHLQSVAAEPEEIDYIKDQLWGGFQPKDILQDILDALEEITLISDETNNH